MPFHQESSGVEQPDIGNMIRELRQAMKLSQEKFAAELGVTFPTINRWENGHATPSPLARKQIDALLKQLSDSPDAIMRECGRALQTKYFPEKDLKA
ncbi:helix-turn-helix domain-containing protein [Fortiea contorta]|uniref:helix-turn-helix domain-containing protein n=1 Tax=Fortiea contorta TaxID=1892405 RepID=UPI0003493213|nr:helix-turn-helix transcriptional regulator [Fortiea contorta]